jgi:membrane-associated phospholipid phosphatase
MHTFLKSISYIFHPVFLPFVGVGFYYSVNPTYIPRDVIFYQLLATFILSVLIPLLFFMLLKTWGKASSFMLENVNERRIPLIATMLITYVIAERIFSDYEHQVLYYFFIGILLSSFLCYLLSMVGFKASVHMMAISGLTVFFIALSIHFKMNIYLVITLLIFLNGAVASSRLHLKAHFPVELIIGGFVGVVPQFVFMFYWMQLV